MFQQINFIAINKQSQNISTEHNLLFHCVVLRTLSNLFDRPARQTHSAHHYGHMSVGVETLTFENNK